MSDKNTIPTNEIAQASIAVFALAILFALPHMVTEQRVSEAAAYAEASDLKDGYCFNDRHDWWDGAICVRRVIAEENLAIAYTAVAPGRDKQYDTGDDYKETRVDLSKSKIVGHWAGDGAKQFVEGLREGVGTPNRHEK